MTPVAEGTAPGLAQGLGGRATVYEDRFDPAAGFMQYATSVMTDKVRRQQAALKKQKEVQEKLANLEIKPAHELDLEELTTFRDSSMDELTVLLKNGQHGDITDATSPLGRVFYNMQKALGTASDMSAQNLELYESQLGAFQSKPGDYDADEYEKRMQYYQGLTTIKDRNDFLTGKTGLPGTDKAPEGQGVGLLVQNLDYFAPVEDLNASEYQNLVENGDITLGSSGPARERIKDVVRQKLLLGNYNNHIAKWGGDDKALENYVDQLTDHLAKQVNTSFTRAEDEKPAEWTWNAGSGMARLGDVTFVVGGQKEKSARLATPEEKAQKRSVHIAGKDYVLQSDDFDIVTISDDGGKPKPYDYDFVDVDGVRKIANLQGTKVIRDNGQYFIEGALATDVVGGDEFSFLQSYKQKNGKFVLPLDRFGNDSKFAAQYQVTLDELGSWMDEHASMQPEIKTRQINTPGFDDSQRRAAETPAETPTPAKTTNAGVATGQGSTPAVNRPVASAEGKEMVQKAVKEFDKPESQGLIDTYLKMQGYVPVFENTTVQVGGRSYDLANDVERLLFEKLFIKP